MNILISGCSLSAGYGYSGGKTDLAIWPSLLGKKFNATINNISKPSNDNASIFLSSLSEFTSNDYDLILLQLTNLDRISLHPSIHSSVVASSESNWASKFGIDKKTYRSFHMALWELNKSYGHWLQLLNIITSVQQLIKKGYNIQFVNGLLDWNEEFFNKRDSEFAKSLINFHTLPDSDINLVLDTINHATSNIDLNLWINPFNSLYTSAIDEVSATDHHPGIKSQILFTDLIYNKLTNN